MSGQSSRSRKQTSAPLPQVILETAVATNPEEEAQETNMRRLTSIPIDPANIPDGMKTPSKLEAEARERAEYEKYLKEEDDRKGKKIMKLLVLGASIATGAIIAYKVAGYLRPEDSIADAIVDETTN